jgi:hypothetical protein
MVVRRSSIFSPSEASFCRLALHAYRRPLAAGQADQADAGQLRDLLRNPRVRQILDAGNGQAGGADRQCDHRRVRRVDLGIDGRSGQQIVG